MTRMLAAASLLALVTAAPGWAQTAPQGATAPAAPAAPGATQPMANQPEAAVTPANPGQADRHFANEAALGGLAEVAAGQLATQKAHSTEVRDFGQRMVQDHTKANERLASIARAESITLPTAPDASHQHALKRLQRLSGVRFDRAYMHRQVGDHEQTVRLLQQEISGGQDAQLKGFASQTLPLVQDHLRMAEQIQHQLSHRGAPMATSGSSGQAKVGGSAAR